MKKVTIEEEGLDHLENIEKELKEIKERTGGRWNSMRNGLYQGAGAVLGSIIAVLFLGWLLSIVGFIPGFGQVGQSIQDVLKQTRGSR